MNAFHSTNLIYSRFFDVAVFSPMRWDYFSPTLAAQEIKYMFDKKKTSHV